MHGLTSEAYFDVLGLDFQGIIELKPFAF